MNIDFSADEQAFRQDVRAFLRDHLPSELSERIALGKRLSKEHQVQWMRILNRQGWLAPGWPVEFGGTGWTDVQKHIFDEECFAAGAPKVLSFGLKMVAPVIIKFGTAEQKAHFLPRILTCEDWWCQGYSEPGAGSDLSSLKTRAVREGDDYVVNGQKTWTTLAHFADWMFCLVRTDPEARQQRGISFLLIDMKTPGITVRPIITLDGEHEVNEVFFDNVRVPVTNLIGEENQGWTCAKYLLTHERTSIGGIAQNKALLGRLKRIASAELRNGRPLIEEPMFRAQVAEVEMQLMAAEMSSLRTLAATQNGDAPGAESSFLKIRGTEIRQAITYLISKAVGPYALPFIEDELGYGSEPLLYTDYSSAATYQYLDARKASIYGGANEIQKNIIAKMILEL
ncbi:acyl-CoA dehydrogenase family protein [Pseudomonas vancouverensis]|uniref:Pimeloyl-CoA dehydrogenase large subunit n=1 Tax=Pseudomonas vancouverensis TaxID=95300 RepID=A0A1H2NI24_PSEVA|nr:acyl-CoA dehydrogenase family protein [Pseudomonas vancouverensis]KAB0489395.1 pimeloyl-CoA dehydrogenase large subunit [Pseudomonas vancouverensis]TDB60907.1 pimeloyl-CoA dehydrogenase large subunit [Pseudomonas vancouverensis]SDV04745.1 Acyl-CoA dehydrogenase [Pseudomonas vancouverensis]